MAQTARVQQPAAGPVPTIVRREAIGQRIDGSVGPGNLNPGAGYHARRTGEPVYCGAIVGQVMGYTEHPNTKDPARTSRRFAGNFLSIDAAGAQHHCHEAYLPSSVERAIKAALDIGSAPVALSIEVWAEPDEQGRPTPIGYRYVSYNRRPRPDNDPLLMLAYESGLLERPAPAIAATATAADGTRYDPETGEILAE